MPLLKKVDAVTVAVPDLDAGLEFYGRALGHELNWRNDAIGQAGLRLPNAETEIVLMSDPFGNVLVLIDLSKGRYATDREGAVTGVEA